VYIAEYGNNRVQVMTAAGRFVSQWGGKGSGPGEFNGAGGLAIDGQGNVYVADQGNSRIQKFSARGAFLTQWGAPGGAKGTGPGEFNTPIGIAVDRDGSIYVTDFGNNRVQKLPAR
jgi:DNA-binding beta-propeller fold protein YncE